MRSFTYSDDLAHAAVVVRSGGGKTKKKEQSIPESSLKPKPKQKIDPSVQKSDATETGIKGKLSKYFGGFVRKGNRMNNSKAYNHDYYMKNKHKWKNSQQVNMPGLILLPVGATNRFIKAIGSFISSSFKSISDRVNRKKGKVQDILRKEGLKKVKNISDPMPHKYLYKVYKNGHWRYFYSDAQYYSFLNKVKRTGSENSIEEDAAAINPNYEEDTLYAINCATCTTMYDLRRRGYDVEALDHFGKQDSGGMVPWQQEDLYKGNGEYASGDFVQPRGLEKVEPIDPNGFDYFARMDASERNSVRIFDELASYGDGARGAVNMYWYDGGGHSMAWEVRDGKTLIIDTQRNIIYDDPMEFAHEEAFYFDWDKEIPFNGDEINAYNTYYDDVDTKPSDSKRRETVYGFEYMRTDNADLNEDVLKGAVYDKVYDSYISDKDTVYEVAKNPEPTKRFTHVRR